MKLARRPRAQQADGRALAAALVVAILLLATAARFHRLGAQSLWYDEGVAHAHSLRSLPQLIPLLQRNVHVPAYFTLLGFWQDLSGSSEFSLRMLSALFSVFGVAMTYALSRRLLPPVAGLAGTAFCALNSFSVYYAQEARMYAMLTAVAVASMWLFSGWLRRGRSGSGARLLIALGLANAIGLYTHVAYALVILAQLAVAALEVCQCLLLRRTSWRSSRLRWLKLFFSYGLTLILFLPWLPVALSQLGAQPNLAQPLALEAMLRRIPGALAFGFNYEMSLDGAAIIGGFLLLVGLIPLFLSRGARWKAALPIVWAAVSVLIYLALGLGERYLRFLLPAQTAVALWLGAGFWALWRLPIGDRWRIPPLGVKLAATGFAALYLLAQLAGLERLYHHPDFQRDDVRGLTARIESELGEGDALLVSAAGFKEVLDYYYRGDAPVYGLPTSADPRDTARDVLRIAQSHGRIFAIFYGSEEQDPERAVERSLNAHTYQASQEWVGDLRFARYIAADEAFERRGLDLAFGDVIRLSEYWLSGEAVGRGDFLLAGFTWLATEGPATRYKVFLQLLDGEGRLVAQRDSEPGGGALPTTSWEPSQSYRDLHALRIPADLPAGGYRLIAGLYDINDPMARLPVGEGAFVELGKIEVRAAN